MLQRLAAWLRQHGIDVKSRHRRASGDLFEVQRRILAGRDPNVIMDCGAHHGRLSREYRRIFPRATIYAFEPTPSTYPVLTARLRGIEGIEPVNAAVGDRDGELTFHVKADDEQSNSALPFEDGEGRQVRVPCLRLDTFCRERGIRHIDVLKIDVEGFELSVLRGASELMERGDIDVILAEVRPDPMRPGAASLMSLGGHLEGLGFHLVGFYNLMWHRDLRIDWFDAIWISDATFRRYTGRGASAATSGLEIKTFPILPQPSRPR